MKNRSIKNIFSELKKLSKSNHSSKKLSFKFESELLDYHPYLKNFSSQHYKLFEELAHQLNLQDSINDLFDGEIVNKTENRQALHHRYRNNQTVLEFDFKKITWPFIKRIKKDGFKNIITFGIGGSYEGPKLLQEYTNKQSSKLNYYFVSGPDRDEFNTILKPLRDQKNFYIFSSKSLSTDETLLCLRWLGAKRNSNNSIVITANTKKAKTLGFNENCIVPFPETVGGRYSIWSPISLSAALENNFSKFLKGGLSADRMLQGGAKIDLQYQKFIKILAFSDLWFSNFLNKNNRVVLSYNWKLRSLQSYIQQLEMESLGKKANPKSIFKETGQSIFGGFGSTAQHSYFQLLHQGTAQFCTDIIYSTSINSPLSRAQAIGQAALLSSDFKESVCLLEKTNSNSPVNLFHLNKLSLEALGFLLATWEHRVFITASMLQINPFDQYGVAAGKLIAKKFLS
ncbi:glucose-6-phosphate isomerase [SAR86 cluster bacterium SAR86E]|uniref:Glucose-6-phosphate isomerase n=1 Tax=SAR86 cluster bacterium SAR86E TaxID=1208365 RepID=K6G4I3_9GAMM|nr:glucose-6-phosphate isomerase [SAR86 cluster bacterium SAR86E]